MAIPPQFKKKMTEARDKALDKKRGIKEGSKKDTAADRRAGLPPDVGAGHSANKRNPKGQGGFPAKAGATKSSRANPFK